MLTNQVAKLPDQTASFRWSQPWPRPALKCPAGRFDGTVNIFLIALRHLRNHLSGGRVLDGKCFARGGIDPLPIDHELAPFLDEAFDPFVESNFCCCDAHNWPPDGFRNRGRVTHVFPITSWRRSFEGSSIAH